MAATYPFWAARLSLLRLTGGIATPTRRYFGKMLIHPSLPACATPHTWVIAHTQVRDPRESAAACFGHAQGDSITLATRSHLSLHRHPETSREVVVEILLILQENQGDFLLELVAAVSRWMFSGLDLLQGV